MRHGGNDALLDQYVRQRRPVAQAEIIGQAHRDRSRMQERDHGSRGRSGTSQPKSRTRPPSARQPRNMVTSQPAMPSAASSGG